MSVYTNPPYPSNQVAPPMPPARPKVLSIAVFGAMGIAGLAVLSSILLMATGRSAVDKAARDVIGPIFDSIPADERGRLLDEAYHSIMSKAIVSLVGAVLILVFALLARNAAMWARVVLAVMLVGGICGLVPTLAETDVVPNGIYALDILVALAAPVLAVLLFLPSVNRYAKARTGRA
jgi:hypothetical protein